MQSDDLKRMLAEAAAEPSRPLDAGAIVRRGRSQRRARAVAAATGLAAVLAGASASLGTLDREPQPGPGPAGERTSEVCEELPPALEVVIFLDDDASRAQVESLGHELQQDAGVVGVSYVSKQKALQQFRQWAEARDVDPFELPPAGAVPASFRIEAADEAAVVRLEATTSPAIDEVLSARELRARSCSVTPPGGHHP